MTICAPLSSEELATLTFLDTTLGYITEPSKVTARLVRLDLVRPTSVGLFVTRAGKLRLRTEHALARDKRSRTVARIGSLR